MKKERLNFVIDSQPRFNPDFFSIWRDLARCFSGYTRQRKLNYNVESPFFLNTGIVLSFTEIFITPRYARPWWSRWARVLLLPDQVITAAADHRGRPELEQEHEEPSCRRRPLWSCRCGSGTNRSQAAGSGSTGGRLRGVPCRGPADGRRRGRPRQQQHVWHPPVWLARKARGSVETTFWILYLLCKQSGRKLCWKSFCKIRSPWFGFIR
jgi:hypothetical protein